MTNAEKLAKDTKFMVGACMNCECLVSCVDCPLCDGNGVCRARAGNEEKLKEWLESDIDETIDMD